MNGAAWPTSSRARFFNSSARLFALLAAIGLLCGIYRFALGLQASTNMNQVFPWGIWIVADVSFIALAAGGFVTAALVYVFNRHEYHFMVRPALLTALLGYTCACVLLAADLGRYYNIWHPLLPSMWQGNSALFEVGMCVMCYLAVLYIEFVPVVCERFRKDSTRPRLAAICSLVHRLLEPVMVGVVILGVAISCLHQSSLGHVMVLAGPKLHPLWWSPILAWLFVLSAVVTGLPTVIFVCLIAWRSLGLRPPVEALARLARFLPILLAAYLAFKVGDLLIRGRIGLLLTTTLESVAFLAEVLLGVVVPMLALMSARVRKHPRMLAGACLLVMTGVVLNRTNVYWLGFHPQLAQTRYFPSLIEWGFTIGVLGAMLLIWRYLAFNLTIVDPPVQGRAEIELPDSKAWEGRVAHVG